MTVIKTGQKSRLLSWAPSSWIPYMEIIRLHKPAGTLYIYYPYLFGSVFAACVKDDIPPPTRVIKTNMLLLGIAFVVRSIGCTWNDIVDRDLDKHVERCRLRPLARGAMRTSNALVFMAAQYAFLFTITGLAARSSLPYLIPVIATGTFYPYAKRITHYAQLILGVSLSMGILVGCNAEGVDPFCLMLSMEGAGAALVALAISYIIWTMIYDSVYAFQDIESDKKIGNKAMSIKFETRVDAVLYSLAAAQIASLGTMGWYLGASAVFYVGIAITGLILLVMVSKVRPEDPDACSWWFEKGSLMVGGGLTASLHIEYLSRLL